MKEIKTAKQVCVSPWRNDVYEMGLVTNVFGRREYRIFKDPIRYFFVEAKSNYDGFYEIKTHDLNAEMITGTSLYEDIMWFDTPQFKSFIQAVAWMKKHANELI